MRALPRASACCAIWKSSPRGSRRTTRGCLIGDFSLETAQASELLRQRLAEIFADWLKPFAACIAAAQQAGTIPARFAPDDLAEFLLASWQGAILA
ncbi:hypothetical protein BTHI11S_01672 [Bosea thiooxidans]